MWVNGTRTHARRVARIICTRTHLALDQQLKHMEVGVLGVDDAELALGQRLRLRSHAQADWSHRVDARKPHVGQDDARVGLDFERKVGECGVWLL